MKITASVKWFSHYNLVSTFLVADSYSEIILKRYEHFRSLMLLLVWDGQVCGMLSKQGEVKRSSLHSSCYDPLIVDYLIDRVSEWFS